MKTAFATVVLLLAASTLLAQNYTAEAKALWDAREKATVEAVRAINDKYQAELEDLYWRAFQAKDPVAAVIKGEIEKLGPMKTTGPSAAPKAVLPKQMVGKWTASYPGGAKGTWEFTEQGTCRVTMGTATIPTSVGTWTKTKDAIEVTDAVGNKTVFSWPIKNKTLSGNDHNGRSVILTEAKK